MIKIIKKKFVINLDYNIEALWQSFGFCVGSWGFGNVLANRVVVMVFL